MTMIPSEQDIHAYVDGRLDGERRAAVERYLAQNPDRAAEVQAWQRDAQRLRAVFGGTQAWADNPALHPSAIRQRQRQRQMQWRSLAAAMVLCLGVGGLGGWQARGMRMESAAAPMADAMAAYRLVATDATARPDVVPRNDDEMQAWLDERFQRATRLPDLSSAGFRAVGGRLFATDQGPAAMVLYRDAAGHAISFYVRPPGPRNRLLPAGQRMENGLMAQYWSGPGYNYAMVSRADGPARQVVARALRQAI
ncbi:anti-sigma factor family protein [Lysobacter changpingensis]|uniref:anti-sigma factor family protein n=1 Tax=Lysobacter changpingensis TaxID=2792784 RepID=UPI001A8F687F|nr:anti-sigma factor [Lysobacter changpingensis]